MSTVYNLGVNGYPQSLSVIYWGREMAKDPTFIYPSNNVLIAITGVSDNELVKGVKLQDGKVLSDTLIIGKLSKGPLMLHL